MTTGLSIYGFLGPKMVRQLIAFAAGSRWIFLRCSRCPCICGGFLGPTTHLSLGRTHGEWSKKRSDQTAKPIIKQSPPANVPSGGWQPIWGAYTDRGTYWILTALAALIGHVRTIGLGIAFPSHRYAEAIVACEVRGWTRTCNGIDDGIMVTQDAKEERGSAGSQPFNHLSLGHSLHTNECKVVCANETIMLITNGSIVVKELFIPTLGIS